MLYNYLHNQRKKQTKMYRLYLTLDLNYKVKKFKLFRMNFKKTKSDIDDILGKIKFNLDSGVVPLKKSIESYNKERVFSDHSFNYLRDSSTMCDGVLKNSIQMCNLLKVLNKDKYLENLESIDEVYDCHVNMVEEIIHYHKIKDSINKSVDESENMFSVESKETI